MHLRNSLSDGQAMIVGMLNDLMNREVWRKPSIKVNEERDEVREILADVLVSQTSTHIIREQTTRWTIRSSGAVEFSKKTVQIVLDHCMGFVRYENFDMETGPCSPTSNNFMVWSKNSTWEKPVLPDPAPSLCGGGGGGTWENEDI